MPIVLICLMLVYAGLGAFSWLQHKKHNNKSYPLKTELLILSGALLVHGAALMFPVLQDRVLITGFGYSLSLIVWLMLMMYCLGSFFYCLRGVQLFIVSLCRIDLIVGFPLPGGFFRSSNRRLIAAVAHRIIIARIRTVWHRYLICHPDPFARPQSAQTPFSALVSFLPPLLSLEKLMFQGMWAGFVLLTYSVISGTFFAETVFGKPMTFTHKTIFSIMSWLIYGALLLKHSMTAWRGKKAAVWTIVGFVSLIFAYVGSKFVLEIVLQRIG